MAEAANSAQAEAAAQDSGAPAASNAQPSDEEITTRLRAMLQGVDMATTTGVQHFIAGLGHL